MPTVTGQVGTVLRDVSAVCKALDVFWKADASGDVEHWFDERLAGYLWKLDSHPTSVAAAYDVELQDVHGRDLFHGQGAGFSASEHETVFLAEDSSPTVAAAEQLDPGGRYKLVVDAAASEYGVLRLWLTCPDRNPA